MAAERFDIEVRDLVAKSIRAELKAIGTEARSTHGLVQQMNQELATGSRAAAASAQTAATSAASAAGRVATATAATSAAEARAATTRTTASTKVKTALESEAQQHTRLADVVERAAKREEAAAARTAAAWQQTSTSVGRSVGSKAQNAASTAFMMNMGRGGGGPTGSPVASGTAAELLAVELASAKAAKGIQSVGQMSNNARIAMLDMTHIGINMGQMLASGVNPMRALVMESGRLATAVQYSGGSIKNLLSSTAAWIGITKKVSDATKDAAAAQAAASAAGIAAIGAQITADITAAETELALAKAQQEVATTATEQAAAAARVVAANEALAASNAEAAITARALSVANQTAAAAAAEATAAETVAVGALGAALGITAVVAGLFVATLGALDHQANQGATGLKTYTKEMGYTASEVKKLNAVTVTWGDTAKAVFEVGGQRIAEAFGMSTKQMRNAWGNALNWMARVTVNTMAGIYAATAGMAYGVANIVGNLGDGKANDNPLKNMIKGANDAKKDADKFLNDVIKQARVNAVDRQDQMATDMYNKPRQKKPKAEWDRAKEWTEANAELDVQIGMLGKYGDALERAQRIEQIGRTFREHGKPLTAAETQLLDDKIKKIQEGTRVQEAMTAAEEEANGPERKYSATKEALNKLFADGAITAEQYTNQLNLATRAYDDAIDPLSALNRELKKTGEIMGLYGRDKDVANYIQQLQQAAEAKGGSIYKRAVGPQGDYTVSGSRRVLTDEAQGMVDQYKKQQRSGELTSKFEEIDPKEKYRQESTTNFILDNYKEMYGEIEKLRAQDLISEQEAADRKKNLDQALGDARLETASGMFAQLAQLQSSHNRTVAAIGKAAAIAQATIDGYRAVQAALAGPPGPPWSFAIAGVTAVMTAANIARIAGVGFQRGGYTGDGSAGDVAGPVHRQEFVFDAAATRRIGVPALEAMRSGARLNGSAAPSNDNGSKANIRIVQGPGTYVEAVERSDGEIEVIAERVTKRVAPAAVAADMRNPNSHTSKAMQTQFGARRQR